MPYAIVPLGNHKYSVINLETSAVHARSTTLRAALSQIRLLEGGGMDREYETLRHVGYGAGEIPAADEIYLALSSEAYKGKDARDPDVKGLMYDHDLSTERTAVYVGPDHVIVAARGTVPTDQSDLKADALIIAGQFDKSDRLKRTIKTVEDTVRKYPGRRLEFTGHSLGGKVASELGKAIGGKVVTFNMGSSPIEIARNLKDKAICALTSSERCKRLKQQIHYTTGVDPISFASLFMHGSRHVRAESANVNGVIAVSAQLVI